LEKIETTNTAMKPLLFILCSGLAGAMYGVSYKLRQQQGYPIESMLFLFALFSTLFSIVFVVLFHQPLYSTTALLLGLPYGLVMTTSLILYFTVTERARLNITWMAIQLSVLIPFSISLLVYGERLRPPAIYGIVCIFLSLLTFGLSRLRGTSPPPVPDRRTGFLLVLASVLSGLAMSFTKFYAAFAQKEGLFALFLFRGLSMMPAAVVFARLRSKPIVRSRPPAGQFALAAVMSLSAVLLGAFIILALQETSGSVAFPLRSVVNVLTVFFLSFLLFGERFTLLEGLGSALAIGGIALVSAAMD
jgi:drug/metabolite transporter (DMT)-like permease